MAAETAQDTLQPAFGLDIVTPNDMHTIDDIVSLDVPAEHGRLAVLAHHQAMVCSLTRGTVTVSHRSGQRDSWRIEPGTLSVGAERSMLLVRDAQLEDNGAEHDR